MALHPPPKTHDWTFQATSMGDPTTPIVVVVCKRCGLMRAEIAPPRRDSRIELDGECPGGPQA
jgi:hypothetical protein